MNHLNHSVESGVGAGESHQQAQEISGGIESLVQEDREHLEELLTHIDPDSMPQMIERAQQLPPPLQKWLLSMLWIVMAIWLQGCMYAPRYGEVFQSSDHQLSGPEVSTRANRVDALLADPTQETQTPALQSGIEPFQRARIRANFEPLISQVSQADFESYLQLCSAAKTMLGIMNPDRYDPAFLRTVVENYLMPERHSERPVIMAIMARKDRESFGVQALSVESYRLQELTTSYKVILVETSSVNEMLHHLTHLHGRGILRQGNLKGVIIGSHADMGTIDAGLMVEELPKLSRLNWFLSTNEPSYIVFATCHSGEGGIQGFDGFGNFVNRAGLLFPRAQAVGCNGIMVGIDYDMDASGRLTEGSLRVERLSDMFGSDTTYKPTYDQLMRRAIPEYSRGIGNGIPQQYVQFALQAGLINADDIVTAFNSGTDPSEYRLYMDCGFAAGDILDFRSHRVSARTVFEYFQSRVYDRRTMIRLAQGGVTPERLVAMYRQGNYDLSSIGGAR